MKKFFFNDTATTEIYTLSLHDALPISFVNLNDTVATMYPLMQSSMDNISEQICKTQSVDNISYSEENQYTASMLLHAVEDALQKAAADTDE